jgi:hypothetical protein
MSAYDKTMQSGSAMHRTLRALLRGCDTAGGIAAKIGSDTKHVFGYLQLHERRGNVRSRRVRYGQTFRVKWAIKPRGEQSLAGAKRSRG